MRARPLATGRAPCTTAPSLAAGHVAWVHQRLPGGPAPGAVRRHGPWPTRPAAATSLAPPPHGQLAHGHPKAVQTESCHGGAGAHRPPARAPWRRHGAAGLAWSPHGRQSAPPRRPRGAAGRGPPCGRPHTGAPPAAPHGTAGTSRLWLRRRSAPRPWRRRPRAGPQALVAAAHCQVLPRQVPPG